eukprot:5706110-Amphidinium_carterae.1
MLSINLAMLRGYQKASQPHEAHACLEAMVRSRIKPSVSLYAELLRGWGGHSSRPEALEGIRTLLKQMVRRYGIRPDATFSRLLSETLSELDAEHIPSDLGMTVWLSQLARPVMNSRSAWRGARRSTRKGRHT